MASTCEYTYNIEIDEEAPRASQPDKILLQLKNHQLACLYKAVMMEQCGTIKYDVKNNIYLNIHNTNRYYHHGTNHIQDKVTVSTNIGILGDIVGYGKTLTALSLIAASPLSDIHINKQYNVSYCSSRNYSYLSYTTNNVHMLQNDNIIKSTLVIVPRGPVYTQWLNALQENTKLKYLAIDNLTYIKKHLPEYKDNNHQDIINYFNQFDVVLIKNTTLDVLLTYYSSASEIDSMTRIPFIRRWKRVMIDEAHDISSKIPLIYYDFIWLISGTYENILTINRSYNNILYHVRDAVNYDTINLVLVKGKKEFVRNSFKIPQPIEKSYLCKFNPIINAIRNFISPEILEKINANDITGAVRDLGGKSETEDSVIELVTREIKRDILNKERERDYINSLDIPEDTKATRLRNVEADILVNKNKLQDLTNRVSELSKKVCSICMFEIDNPIILECTHSYCGVCIMKWLEKNMNCPECRTKIDANKLIAISKDDVAPENKIVESPAAAPGLLTKEETLMNIIKDNPDGKYLVFSKYDSGFFKLMQTLNSNNITCSELKGNTSHMNNVLEKFRNGQIKVILLNTFFAGSGIDISYATDVILYHSMGLERYQAIGRAQRVGRTEVLKIHHLCYEHEMN